MNHPEGFGPITQVDIARLRDELARLDAVAAAGVEDPPGPWQPFHGRCTHCGLFAGHARSCRHSTFVAGLGDPAE